MPPSSELHNQVHLILLLINIYEEFDILHGFSSSMYIYTSYTLMSTFETTHIIPHMHIYSW